MSQPNKRYEGLVESVGFGVAPDSNLISNLNDNLPDVRRTLNWVRLTSASPCVCGCCILPAKTSALGSLPWSSCVVKNPQEIRISEISQGQPLPLNHDFRPLVMVLSEG